MELWVAADALPGPQPMLLHARAQRCLLRSVPYSILPAQCRRAPGLHDKLQVGLQLATAGCCTCVCTQLAGPQGSLWPCWRCHVLPESLRSIIEACTAADRIGACAIAGDTGCCRPRYPAGAGWHRHATWADPPSICSAHSHCTLSTCGNRAAHQQHLPVYLLCPGS